MEIDINGQLVRELRPVSSYNFVGNRGVMDLVTSNLRMDVFPHLSMVIGRNGTGKSALAEYIGLSLTCNNKVDGEPCCECRHCRNTLDTGFKGDNVKKFDMGQKLSNSDIKNVLREIFTFESINEKTVYILDEMQRVSLNDQTEFLEYFTKIPKDVYIIICTDDKSKISAALTNRVVELEMTVPETSEAIEFLEKVSKQLGIVIQSKEVAKMFVKGCNNNLRGVLTKLELFRALRLVTKETVSAIFKLDTSVPEKLWELIFDNSKDTYELVEYISSIEDKENIKKAYENLQNLSVKRLGELNCVIDEGELSNVQKGRCKKLVSDNMQHYGEVLAILREKYTDDNQAIINITRAKLYLITKQVKEKELVARSSTSISQGSNFFSKYQS